MTAAGAAEPPARFLIVNADDLGLTVGINRGIIEAHERGIVTSASLMVRQPAARHAAEYAKSEPGLSVGLHFDVAEWCFQSGAWKQVYQVVDLKDEDAIAKEFERQLAAYEKLLANPPTHLDSHQHVHRLEPIRSILSRYAEDLRVPLRHSPSSPGYVGRFYGQMPDGRTFPPGISLSTVIDIIAALPTGWSEMVCHPGYPDELKSPYRMERAEELRVLCSPEVCDALATARIELKSFAEFAPLGAGQEAS